MCAREQGRRVYQCKTLREHAPPAQQGPALPPFPLSLDDRLATARVVPDGDGRLNDWFFAYTRSLLR